MEVLIVGTLCGIAFALSTLLWQLHVRPDLVLGLLHDGEGEPPQPDPRAVRWLVWTLSIALLAVGFMTGAALSFLAATQNLPRL